MKQSSLLPPTLSPEFSGRFRHNQNQGLNKFLWKKFIILIINLLMIVGQNNAQVPSHEQIYNRLVIDFLKKNPQKVSAAEGLVTDTIKPFIQLDSTSQKLLVLSPPEITIEKTGSGNASRRIFVQAEYKDSLSGVLSNLEYADTFSFKAWKQVQKTEQNLLRADDPRFMHRTLFPLLCILTGIGGIITLFYLRS